MAYFAKLDQNNIVIQVIAVGNDVLAYDGDPAGEVYCMNTFGGGNGVTWKQTSYNTRNGIYYTPSHGTTPQPDPDQSKAFRYTFAGIGMIYNQERDAFIESQPYSSWTLGEDNVWHAPIQYTNLNGPNGATITYPKWIEASQKWTGIGLSALPQDSSEQTFNNISNINCEWSPSTSTWVEV
jgi:hypothetical protein